MQCHYIVYIFSDIVHWSSDVHIIPVNQIYQMKYWVVFFFYYLKVLKSSSIAAFVIGSLGKRANQ